MRHSIDSEREEVGYQQTVIELCVVVRAWSRRGRVWCSTDGNAANPFEEPGQNSRAWPGYARVVGSPAASLGWESSSGRNTYPIVNKLRMRERIGAAARGTCTINAYSF